MTTKPPKRRTQVARQVQTCNQKEWSGLETSIQQVSSCYNVQKTKYLQDTCNAGLVYILLRFT